LVFGPGDRLVTHLITLLRFSPLVPVIGPDNTTFQPVWIGDVCTAVLRALKDSKTDGRTFHLGGPAAMSFAQIIDAVKTGTGRRAMNVRVPSFITTPFLKLGEQIFGEPPLTSEQLGLLAAGGACDPGPAAVTFGLRMRTLADALQDYRPRG
jgi:NADH dehydrogenase